MDLAGWIVLNDMQEFNVALLPHRQLCEYSKRFFRHSSEESFEKTPLGWINLSSLA